MHLSHLSLSQLRSISASFIPGDSNGARSSLLVTNSILARLRTYGKCNEKQQKEEMSSFTNLSVGLDSHKTCLHLILYIQYLQVWEALGK